MSENEQNNNSSSKAKNNKEITISLNLKHLILAIIIVVLSPVLVAIGITWPKGTWLSNTTADANSWLQFWGSMLGGIIGTLAVIYVAHIQNVKQEEQLQRQINIQERLLDRQILQNEELNNKLIKLEENKIKRELYTNFLEKLTPFNQKLFDYTVQYEIHLKLIKEDNKNILSDKNYLSYIFKAFKELKENEHLLSEEYTYLQQRYETIIPNLNNQMKDIDFPIMNFYITTTKDIEEFLLDDDIDKHCRIHRKLNRELLQLEYHIVFELKKINSFGKFTIE